MKITMYELLGMVKDGKAPKKIKVGNKIYNYETFNIGKGDNYFTAEWEEVKGYRISYDGTYYYLEIRDYNLNDEVEILEEEKKTSTLNDIRESYGLPRIEEKKIPEKICTNRIINTKDILEFEMIQNKINAEYTHAINSIIDYLKSKGE